MNLLCFLGMHNLQRLGSFHRKCSCCGAEYYADYFEWRVNGYPTWVKIESKEKIK